MVIGTTVGDDPGELGQVLSAVGPRLRALRRQRGATLAQLAAATGISVSTLSRLEAGHRRPTLELLLPLAREHQVALEDLVRLPATTDPRVPRRSVTRDGWTMFPLTRRSGGVQAYKIVVPEVAQHGDPEQQVHDGYDWIYVLSGRVRLLLAEHDLVLDVGEVAEFDTRTPHAFLNPGPGPAELICLFGPQGERLHVRARPHRR